MFNDTDGCVDCPQGTWGVPYRLSWSSTTCFDCGTDFDNTFNALQNLWSSKVDAALNLIRFCPSLLTKQSIKYLNTYVFGEKFTSNGAPGLVLDPVVQQETPTTTTGLQCKDGFVAISAESGTSDVCVPVKCSIGEFGKPDFQNSRLKSMHGTH